MSETSADLATASESTIAAEPLQIFINYRHSDAGGWARFLYDRLAAQFGGENIFFDGVTLQPGRNWVHEIRSHAAGCSAFLALIGPRWAKTLSERARGVEEDQVRAEIEAALRGRRIEVIPVLLDDAQMPNQREVPESLHPLLRRHKLDVRPGCLDADLEALIATLEKIEPVTEDDGGPIGGGVTPVDGVKASDPAIPAPNAEHYEEVARVMVKRGSVIPFLGPGANSSDRDEPWRDVNCGYLPDADELAAYLAHEFNMEKPVDLAEISQYVSVTESPGELYKALGKTLESRCPPSSVHRHLANFPKTLRDLGLTERYQLIVTTNYDDALERAFDDAEEPYDLAVYMASGDKKGKFVHVPYGKEPETVEVANEYFGFPIETWGELQRTVIVKIHGAVNDPRRVDVWRNNYVITENDYIDYLTRGELSKIVPTQILAKLKDDRLLFLGYTMRDWNLRVFLQRIFGQPLPNNPWAIAHHEPNRLETKFWKQLGVELFKQPLGAYVAELDAAVAALSRAPV